MRTLLSLTAVAAYRVPTRALARRSSTLHMGVATAGDYVKVRYSLKDAKTKEALSGSAAPFDQGDVSLVVDGGGFIPGLHARVPDLPASGTETFTLTPGTRREVPSQRAPDCAQSACRMFDPHCEQLSASAMRIPIWVLRGFRLRPARLDWRRACACSWRPA